MIKYHEPYSPDVVVAKLIIIEAKEEVKPWTLIDRVPVEENEARRALKYLLKSGDLRINAAGEVVVP